MTEGLGTITWWGFTPALDLQNEVQETTSVMQNVDAISDQLNILLVGAGDIRHVLQTAAHRCRHKRRKIHFYVVETALELYARDMLLLMIALENSRRMGLQEKSELFLEIFGNILIRQQSAKYVEHVSRELIKMVTDFSYLEKTLPAIDLSQLKFKERDFLEGIFKFWLNQDKKYFDVAQYWNLRLRRHLTVRYDFRMNIFDWDYNMRLIDVGGDVINRKEYQQWRNTGVAFQLREGDYDVPNKTLASGIIFNHDGERIAARGFWGDIVVSPYITFGIESEEKSLFKKCNSVYDKTSQEISMYNVLAMFYEILHKEKYVLPQTENLKTTEASTSKLEEIIEEDEMSCTEGGKIEKNLRREVTGEQEGTVGQGSEEQTGNEIKMANAVGDSENQNTNGEKLTDTEESQTVTMSCPAELRYNARSLGGSSPVEQKYEALPLDDITITFLPLNCLPDLKKKGQVPKNFPSDVLFK